MAETLVQLRNSNFDGLDVLFDLAMTEWRSKTKTNAIVLNVPDFQNLPLPLNYVDMEITIKGNIYKRHEPHAVTGGVAHVPDVIDLEEAAVRWNKDVPEVLPTVSLPLVGTAAEGGGSGVQRVYSGVIKRVTIVDNPGTDQYDFTVVFGVSWNVSNPDLREWNTAP